MLTVFNWSMKIGTNDQRLQRFFPVLRTKLKEAGVISKAKRDKNQNPPEATWKEKSLELVPLQKQQHFGCIR